MARRAVAAVVLGLMVVAFGVSVPGSAQGTGTPRAGAEFVNDREVDLTIDSAAMAAPMRIKLLLPRDWHAAPDTRFPVLYLLPGYGSADNHDDWVERTDLRQLSGDSNVLIAMPEAGAVGMYSDWWNFGNGGPPAWETFHTVELPQVLEREWRASDRRGVAGVSMGGYGAMSYAARKPGMFAVAASFSGYLHTTSPAVVLFLQSLLRHDGLDPAALWGDPLLNADIWAAHDPFVQADKLRGTTLLISGGNGDRRPLTPEELTQLTQQELEDIDIGNELENLASQNSREFVTRLDELGIPHTSDFGSPGIHNWVWFQDELHRAWPALLAALVPPV